MLKQELWLSVKRFAWGTLGMSLSALIVFVQGNLGLLDLTNLSTETKGVIVMILGYLLNDLTKRINQTWNLEEKIGRALGVKK